MNAQAPVEASRSRKRRIKPIRQAEAAECGLASLAMVANSRGHDFDLNALRRRFGTSSRGIGLRQIMDAASSLGLSPRALKVPLDDLGELELPAILHWDMDHFVVLERVSRGRAYIVDPAGDGRWHDAASLSRHYTGVALELTPQAGFEPTRERGGLRLRQLWAGAAGFKSAIAKAAILSLLLQAHVLASPFLLQLGIDAALPAGDMALMTILALGFGLFAIVNAGAFLLRSLVLLCSGTALAFAISSRFGRHLMRLPIGWFERRSVGDILSRFQSVQPIQHLLTESAAAALIDGLLAVLTLALMLLYSPLLTLVPLVSIAVYGAYRAYTLPLERRAENERIAAAGREQSAMIESLRGIVTLRLAGREALRHRLWQNRLSEALNAKYAYERIHAWQASVSILLLTLELVLIVWLAVRMTAAGSFTVGMIFAFLAWRLQFGFATKSLIDKSADFGMLSVHLDRLGDIALTAEDAGFGEPESAAEPPAGDIALRGVTFAYSPHEPEVLAGIDIHIRPGEHVAITGPSGSGKTTLSKILVGLLDPTAGTVLIDGVPLPAYGRRAFRAHVAAVLQDDLLFAGTIADNVAGFEPVDEARLQAALDAAAIRDDVEAMPMRHLTLVGDMGSTLSGGQVQRILLARALYRRPRILVMDEGTSHLDAAHEKQVNASIAALGITRIVIAHRRETLAAAERVIVLEKGRVAG